MGKISTSKIGEYEPYIDSFQLEEQMEDNPGCLIGGIIVLLSFLAALLIG